MTATPARLVVLGIDAASPALLERWAGDGALPNLRALMDRGLTGATRNVDGLFIGATWPSLYTGVTPARHGFHYLLQLEPGTYALRRPAASGLVAREPFWETLSRAGRRVAVLDVPLSRPATGLNGIQTVEWGGHDAVYGFHTTPPDLAREILAAYGPHPMRASCDGARESAEDYLALVTALEEGARRKGELTRDLLARGGWDLFTQVFTESHCAGHQCWHLHDAAHPAHDPAIAAALGDPLRRVYAAIDAAIGRVLDAAGHSTVVVLAAHGMAHWFGAQFLLPEILFRLDVAAPPPRPRRGPSRLALDAAAAVWHGLPEPLRAPLRPVREMLGGRAQARRGPPTLGADPAASLCFPHPNGLAVGGIRLNLAGREPRGRLRPGAEADAFCDELEARLLEIVDDRTGAPLIRRVLRTGRIFQGEYVDHLPDLLVEWSDEAPTGSVAMAGGRGATVRARSPAIGTIEGENHYGRSGEHRPAGWFVAAGPGISAGRLDRPVSILDLAPTFAAMLGVELPACDGRPIPQLTRA